MAIKPKHIRLFEINCIIFRIMLVQSKCMTPADSGLTNYLAWYVSGPDFLAKNLDVTHVPVLQFLWKSFVFLYLFPVPFILKALTTGDFLNDAK